MSSPQVNWDAPKAAPQVKWDAPEQPGILDKEIPLDSYTHATESGLQSIGRGVRGAAQGLVHTIAHPIDTLKSVGEIPSQVAQIPAAIHDINQSADPLSNYAKAAQETAGQGAGQALLAIGTEGITRGAGPAARIAKPAVRAGLRTASEIVDPDVTGVVSPRLAHVQRLAGRIAGKMDPAEVPAPPKVSGPPLRFNTVRPEPEALPETSAPPVKFSTRIAKPESAPETAPPPVKFSTRIAKPSAAPEPIPAKPAPEAPPIARPSSNDPILDRLRQNAATIEQEGHGDEIPEPAEAAPITTNLNQDLTPALKASLAKVRAAKRIARPNSKTIQ